MDSTMEDTRQIALTQTLGRRIRRFFSDRRGNVAVLAAFSFVPLITAVGVATDTTRAYLLNNRLQEAIDIAALAAARGDDDLAGRQAILEQYFWANYPAGYLGAAIEGPTLVPLAGEQLGVEISATLPNTFLQVIDIDTTQVEVEAVVQKERRGMELVLVMDNTGSMRHNSKIVTMRNAALRLIDTLYGTNETLEEFWVGIVPYQATVNIGYAHADWLAFNGHSPRHSYFIDPLEEDYIPHYGYYSWDRSYFSPGRPDGSRATVYMDEILRTDMYRMFQSGDEYYDPMPVGWKGCVEARHTGGRDQTDDPPIYPDLFTPYYHESAYDNDWCRFDDDSYFYNGDYCENPMTSPGTDPRELLIRIDERNAAFADGTALGPNRGCPQPILPLVAERTTVEDAIKQMQPWRTGGTFGNLGLVWGWRTISPRWRGYWNGSPSSLPLDYDTPLMDKVVIMLTDGNNEFVWDDYTSYGRPSENRLGSGNDTDELDARMANVCEAMKNEGIILYTITFRLNDSDTQALYRNCATSPDYYFNSPDNATLDAVFDTIATQLSNLRLAQ